MPDGSESPENTQTKNLIKLISDLVDCPSFSADNVKENFIFNIRKFKPAQVSWDIRPTKFRILIFQNKGPGL